MEILLIMSNSTQSPHTLLARETAERLADEDLKTLLIDAREEPEPLEELFGYCRYGRTLDKVIADRIPANTVEFLLKKNLYFIPGSTDFRKLCQKSGNEKLLKEYLEKSCDDTFDFVIVLAPCNCEPDGIVVLNAGQYTVLVLDENKCPSQDAMEAKSTIDAVNACFGTDLSILALFTNNHHGSASCSNRCNLAELAASAGAKFAFNYQTVRSRKRPGTNLSGRCEGLPQYISSPDFNVFVDMIETETIFKSWASAIEGVLE